MFEGEEKMIDEDDMENKEVFEGEKKDDEDDEENE